jgi:Na+-transporting NADH:ubiquinone oxidoreductase subunit C
MQRDGILNTLIVATVLCLVCALLVSGAAIQLKERQDRNVELFRKRNVLQVAGMDMDAIDKAGGVAKAFDALVEDQIIDLESGTDGSEALASAMGLPVAEALAKYDPNKAAKNATADGKLATPFANRKDDRAGIGAGRENFQHVYRFTPADGGEAVWVFPVRGKGLWSLLEGFIALKSDLKTVAGLTYFKHGETPGLGGEIDNPSWKSKWPGKQAFDDSNNVAIEVVKGPADAANVHGVDGLAGATITSNGVTKMLEFWLGPEGFGPFIEKQRSGTGPASSTPTGSGPATAPASH